GDENRFLAQLFFRFAERDGREGIAFSEAIKKHPRVFSNFFSSMALAGEASGNLEEALDQIGLQLITYRSFSRFHLHVTTSNARSAPPKMRHQ
ncbi:type II secretion system F family protein, partial [Acinetobacter soli]